MSIDFFPAGNHEYCEANNLMETTTYKCQCVDFPEHFVGSVCRDCNGTGKVSFTNPLFEMNASNGNALALLEMLGVKSPDYSGCVDAQTVLDGIAFIRSMNAAGHSPLVTKTTQERNIVSCGRSPEQVESYLDRMQGIALEAARRKVEIVWG